jgi:hypothetical protein
MAFIFLVSVYFTKRWRIIGSTIRSKYLEKLAKELSDYLA